MAKRKYDTSKRKEAAKKNQEGIKTIVGFDTETEQFIDENGDSHNWLMSIQLYTDGIEPIVIKSDFEPIYENYIKYGVSPDSMVELNRARMSKAMLKELKQLYRPDGEAYLFALNLAFDASQIDVFSKNELMMAKMASLKLRPSEKKDKAGLLTQQSRPLGGELWLSPKDTKRVIKVLVRDVGKFYMGGLDAVAKDVLGMEKYKNPDLAGPKPFNDVDGFNRWWNDTIFGNYEYATRDAIITQKAGKVIVATYDDAITISSAAMRRFKEAYETATGDKADTLFWPANKKAEIYDIAKEAAAGGLTLSPSNEYLDFVGKPKVMLHDNVVKMDITSAYPRAMLSVRYPDPNLADFFIIKDLELLKHRLSTHPNKFYLIRFNELTFDYPESTMTDIVKTSRRSSAKAFFAVHEPRSLSLIDIVGRRFVERAINIKFDEVLLYEFDYNDQATEVAKQYIYEAFDKKATGKRTGNKLMELEGKALMNNLTGKFNQFIREEEYLIDNEIYHTEHDFNLDPHWFNPLYYAQITAFTRAQMIDMIDYFGIDNVIQADTDSLKITVDSDAAIANYKQELAKLNAIYGDEHTGLGMIKEEGYFKSYMTLQRKVHGGLAISHNGSPTHISDFEVPDEQLHHAWAHAGMSDKAFDNIVGRAKTIDEVYRIMLLEPQYEAIMARRTKYGIVLKVGMKSVKSAIDLRDVVDEMRATGDAKGVIERLRKYYEIENVVNYRGTEELML